MFCPKCGTQNVDSAKFCQKCGANLTGGVTPPPQPPLNPVPPPGPGTMRGVHRPVSAPLAGKNPTTALVLSILIPGLGQFYNGDNKKGAVMLGVAVILGPLTLGLLWLGVMIWSVIDAYQVASGQTARW